MPLCYNISIEKIINGIFQLANMIIKRNDYQANKRLITGNALFIGTNLVKELNSMGYEVTSYDLYKTG